MNVPTTKPTLHRRFQFTDLQNNNNKFWEVRFWESDGIYQIHYGRVGTGGQYALKTGSLASVTKAITEKLAKGYKEIKLHVVTAAAAAGAGTYHAAVSAVVKDILAAAGQQIKAFLNTTVDALSQVMIDAARGVLDDVVAMQGQGAGSTAQFPKLQALVQRFYTLIPTKLPHKINPSAVVNQFLATIPDQYDRLNQLEAALSQVAASRGSTTGPWSAFDALASQMRRVEPGSAEWLEIAGGIGTTMVHGYTVKIKDVFAVTIQSERARYDACKRGKTNVRRLYHGTRAGNLVHILKDGLKIMPVAATGSMFGRGLYFACQASKSTNYCSNTPSGGQILIVCDVALGKQFVAPQAHHYTAAPHGHDSVWGKPGTTSGLINHEYIVYQEDQQTIRYIVTYDR